MPTSKVIRIYYRSLYNGGKLWCESRSSEEVIRMSTGEHTPTRGIEKYEKATVIEVSNDWEPWNPFE